MIVTGGISDPTNGANAWYSPRKFIVHKEKEAIDEEADVSDSLEKVYWSTNFNSIDKWT